MMSGLSEGASGWELPIKLRLSLPNGTVKERQVSLFQKPRGEWIELNLGKFRTGKREKHQKQTKFALIFMNMGPIGNTDLSSEVPF
ncbi:Phloem protein 2-like protein [Corchorus olitorius]|uniref:Phloem protein 2-like protein n=1 Tax=Corchorus olitorius TaxID=93759 RepID=A0A1R3H0G1_9ROSI|nr:Phloem protein 2-like protein [Corchorus olitorius]